MNNQRAITSCFTGLLSQFELTDRKVNKQVTNYCYATGIGVVKDSASQLKRFKGAIPLIGHHFKMRWCYYTSGNKYNDVLNLVSHKLPEIDRRSIRFNFLVLRKSLYNAKPEYMMDKDKQHLNINIMCLIYKDDAIKAVTDYDILHGTRFLPQLFFMFDCEKELMADENRFAPVQKTMKAVFIAQFLTFFENLFGVDFYSLTLIEWSMLVRILKKIQYHGPLKAIQSPIEFRFDKHGFPVGSDASRNASSSTGAADDDADAEGPDEDLFMEMENKVKLMINYRRALALYKDQKRRGFDLDTDELDTGEGVEVDGEDNREYDRIASLFASISNSTEPKEKEKTTTTSSVSIPVSITRNGKKTEFIAMSSDYKTTKILPLDMRTLSDVDWIEMLICDEILMRAYNEKRNFYVIGQLIIDKITYESGREDFPVKDMSIELVEKAIRRMMKENKLVIYNSDPNMRGFVTPEQLEKDYPESGSTFFLAHACFYMYALRYIAEIEIDIAKSLNDLVAKRSKEHEELNNKIKTYNVAIYTEGLDLHPLQLQGVQSVLHRPFTLIDGAGGTGKSAIMRIAYRTLRNVFPDGHFLFTSFKNDTVNQMRSAITQGGSIDDGYVHFSTTDMFNLRGGIDDKSTKDTENRKKIAFTACFVDEASMLSAEHVQKLFHHLKLDSSTFKRLIMLGDGEQLEPIRPGCPFVDFLKVYKDAARVTLQMNYRAKTVKLVEFLGNIRAGKPVVSRAATFEDIRKCQSYSNVIIDDIPCENAANPKVMIQYAEKVLDLLSKIDPQRKRYNEIIAVSPYNNMSDLVSYCFTLYYFENYKVRPSIFMSASATLKRKISTINNDDDDDDDRDEEEDLDDDECVRIVHNANPDLARALEYALRMANFKRATISGASIEPPRLYLGMEVTCVRTDIKNKEIAAGRIDKLTHIVDHPLGVKLNLEWLPERGGSLPPGFTLKNHTGHAVDRPISGGVMRTLVIGNRTPLEFKYGNGIHNLLRSAKCTTVHKRQGSQSPVCIGVYPPGMLSHRKIFYTGVSRAQNQSFIISNIDNVNKMISTEPEKTLTALSSLLEDDLDVMIIMGDYK